MKKRYVSMITMTILSLFFLIFTVSTIFVIYVKNNIDLEADVESYYKACGESITEFYYFERDENGEIISDSAIVLSDSSIYSTEKRLYAPYDTIPDDLINAFVAIEDKRFFEHNGVDWYRTFGAGLNYIFRFRDKFGASTITQQLVKNVTGNDGYNIRRKLQEIFYARSLEDQLNKDQILELYLNVINLSQGCRGVRTASITYFSKELSELDLGECVCIAAITQNPSYYDPYRNPENNKSRRQVILDEMLSAGYISAAERDKYYDKDIELCMSDRFRNERVNSWYVDMVIDDVCCDLRDKYGYTREEAESMIFSGGLKIYTLMDPQVQRIVEKYYGDQDNFPDATGAIKAQSSMIILDPYTGDILGVAGGRGEKSANRIQNYATQTLRPSGSVIKPLSVYAPALEDNIITYATVYDDVPVIFSDPDNGESEMRAWPVNAPNVYHGLVNVNYAVEVSLNTVAVKILEDLGKERSFYFLKETLGMENLIEELVLENETVLTDMDTAALALGQMNYGVTVREVVSAYTVLTNEGKVCKSRSYAFVTDFEGEVILENRPNETQAISKDNSIIMTKMLENVVDYGTARYVYLDEQIPVAGKTGTSQDYKDRWFIGYTPYYLGGVWYGYEYPRPLDNNTQYICTRIWNEVMTEIHAIYKGSGRSFADSDNIISANYCSDSGKLIGEAGLLDPRGIRAERGYFVKGTEPTEQCDCHVVVEYDAYNGGVSLGSCPEEKTVYVGLIRAERRFPVQVYISDAQYVWKELKKGFRPSESDGLPFFSNMIPKGEYWGISLSDLQFNRSCKAHQ